jgi:hypothetical protein
LRAGEGIGADVGREREVARAGGIGVDQGGDATAAEVRELERKLTGVAQRLYDVPAWARA